MTPHERRNALDGLAIDYALKYPKCRLCSLLIETRQENIAILRDRIAMNEAEIAEIQRGDRHNDYHEAQLFPIGEAGAP